MTTKKNDETNHQPEPPTGMRIIRFGAENIKRLKVVDITPTDDVVEITGPNGSGKSSVLDSIEWVLRGTSTLPKQPIRRGAKGARIVADIDNGDGTGFLVTRKFIEGSNNRNGVLEVFSKSAKSKLDRPQAVLDAFMGRITFDPLEFMRMKPEAQLAELRKVAPVNVDMDAIAAERKVDYYARRDLDRDADTLEARATGIEIAADLPADRVSVEDLVQQLRQGDEANAQRDSLLVQRETLLKTHQRENTNAEKLRRRALDLREQAAQLLRDAESIDQQGDEARRESDAAQEAYDAMQIPEVMATDDIHNQITAATQTNEAIARRAQRDQLLADVEEKRTAARALGQKIEQSDRDRDAAVAAALMPVEGLSYGEDEVLFEGLPFGQLSDAAQIKISVALAMAANPTLRVLRIKDGSLLDEKSLNQIKSMAREHHYQMWIERVEGSSKVGFVMEDGEVVDHVTD